MAEVLIDDSSLNDIANSLRTKNGLIRTYRPSEMPAAIRALRDTIPSTHGYTIRIELSPHLTIYVDLYLDNQSLTYNRSFTVGEPLWKFRARIEPEAGYLAGVLNYSGTYSINRDYLILASPAIIVPNNYVTVYMNGNRYDGLAGYLMYAYTESSCTNVIHKDTIYTDLLIINDVSDGHHYNFSYLLGGDDPCKNAIEIQQNFDVSRKRNLSSAVSNLTYTKRINLSNWNPVNVETMFRFAYFCSSMQDYGDISQWNMPELINLDLAFYENSKLESLDLHDWYCPKLENCQTMFAGDIKLKCVDISGLSTNENLVRCSGMFSNCESLEYIIMDRDEVMFSNIAPFDNPNNKVKYLVPQELVDAYKTHPNWSSRASRIDSILNYTIDRYNGHVFVSRNV